MSIQNSGIVANGMNLDVSGDVLYLNADEANNAAQTHANHDEAASDEEEFEEKAANFRNHQFQISIHAGVEEDLDDLNYDSITADKPNTNTSSQNEASFEEKREDTGLVQDSMSKPSNEDSFVEGEANRMQGGVAEQQPKMSSVDDGVMNDMKYLFKNTRYFLIKSNNFENVNLAKSKVLHFFWV
jgi:hypothetical protein